jgi:hypothetical protein
LDQGRERLEGCFRDHPAGPAHTGREANHEALAYDGVIVRSPEVDTLMAVKTTPLGCGGA